MKKEKKDTEVQRLENEVNLLQAQLQHAKKEWVNNQSSEVLVLRQRLEEVRDENCKWRQRIAQASELLKKKNSEIFFLSCGKKTDFELLNKDPESFFKNMCPE